MSTASHREQAAKDKKTIRIAVLTISDTRTVETDASGKTMMNMLFDAQHDIAHYSILKDEPNIIIDHIRQLATQKSVDVILTNGGTGIAKRDSTVEAIESLMEKKLVGFGELFRMLSFDQVGSAAMLSRAVAGTFQGMIIFSTPGSTPAVSLAMEKLIIPELPHIVWEMLR